MNLNKIRDLDIAKNQFNFSKEIIDELDYEKWKQYVDNQSIYFVWIENTQKGKETLFNIDNVPDWVKARIIIGYDKRTCCAEYCDKKKSYNINVSFHKELKRIKVSFERKVKIKDLELFLDMANYLDAYLLHNGKEIIDEKVIESLE